MHQTADSAARFMPKIPRLEVNDRKAAAEGIRRIDGKHLTLYTDLPPDASLDELPAAFDQAFPQWCEYFRLDPTEHADWHCTGMLMREKDRFRRAGLLPDNLPPFPHGYSRNYDFWLYEQPSEYYRRHLLLHEGVHSFMNTLLGACGPPWYMEGMAELLATHDWTDGHLRTNVMPPSAEAVPHWGRVKLIRDAFDERRAMPLKRVVEYPLSAHRETEPYAWCWAAAILLDRHPAYREIFRRLSDHVTRADFNARFYRAVGDRWPELAAQWQVFIDGLDYGYDIPRAVIDFSPGRRLPADGATVEVATDRGWQNSGWRLEPGRTYRLTGRGRFTLAPRAVSRGDGSPSSATLWPDGGSLPEPADSIAALQAGWPCEANGVTIRYHAGRPLGMLLAAVQPASPTSDGDAPPDQTTPTVTPLLWPVAIGLNGEIKPSVRGTLMLKINDSPVELAGNRGQLSVRVTPR